MIIDNNNFLISNNNFILLENNVDSIKNLIYTIRERQVILDSDVAKLYHYDTKRINETVQRNKERFPENFCFRLTKAEAEFILCGRNLRPHDNSKKRNKNKLPYAFTEQGIAMLSGLLKNDIAIQVSINIMNAFVEMRKFIYNNSNLFERLISIENKLLDYDKKFDLVFNELQKNEDFNQKIFFNGQIYDAYSIIIDIIKSANNSILIIDNYIDDSILKMLSKKNNNVSISILTTQHSNIKHIDIKKFNMQYPTLKLSYSNKFHDRFIIVDNKDLYHIGASLKDLGKKCFAISKIDDNDYIEKIINLH